MYEYDAEVVAVHDGDTINVHLDQGLDTWRHTSVRLNGIDAPELGKVKSPTDGGEEATLCLMDILGGRELFAEQRTKGRFGNFGDYLVLPGVKIYIRVKTKLAKETEKYGRVLGTVWVFRDGVLDQESLSDKMLASGHAVAKTYTLSPKDRSSS